MLVYLQLYSWHDAWALPESYRGHLEKEFPDCRFIHEEQRYPDPETLKLAEVLVAWRLREEHLEHAEQLQWMHTPAAGVGGQLYPEFVESEIRLTNGSGLNSSFVAEHGLTLMMSWLRGVHLMDSDGDYRETREKIWDRYRLMEPFPEKKTLIVGLGQIGQSLARNLRRLGQKVTGVRKTNRVTIEPGFEVYPEAELEQLLPQYDFVVNCLPLTDGTRESFGAREFSLMSEDACFVNLGRGKTVEESALIEALQDGYLAGAALDVFYEEPLPGDSELRKIDEVLISPHVSATTADTWRPQIELLEKNLRRYRQGEELLNLVDKERGY